MGNVRYQVALAGTLAISLKPGDDVRDGLFGFVAPAGSHDAVITVGGARYALRFAGQ